MTVTHQTGDSVSSPDIPVPVVIGAVAVTLLVASLGQTIVTTAMPRIAAELGGLDHVTWLITAYLLASTVSAPISGKLGDLFGRKIVLQGAILVFLAGSVICGFAGGMAQLVAGRAVQGLGGGGLIVVAMAVVADVLPPRQRGRAQGLMGGVFGISTVIGPLLGGFLVEALSWHWVFFVNLPVGLAALAVLAVTLETPAERRRPAIDYAGAALLAVILALAVAISNLGGTVLAWSSAPMVELIAGLVAALVLFAVVERRAEEPVLPLPLFRNNAFLICNGVGFLVGMAMFGTIAFVPLYLQTVQGVSPAGSGMFLLPMMGGLIGTSMLAGQVMARTGRYRLLPILSTALLAVAMALLATIGPETSLWRLGLNMALVGIGIGPVMSVGVTAIQNAVPRGMLGVGTASANMFRLIGGSLGTSAFGAVFAAGLARNLAGMVPSGGALGAVGPEMVAALPAAERAGVIAGFSDALHPVFLASAAVAAVAAVLGLMLRELPLGEGA